MDYKTIKKKIEPVLQTIANLYERDCETKNKKKGAESNYLQIITTRLKSILANPNDNPVMPNEVAHRYYFGEENGLKNTTEKYCLILDLQNFIVEKTNLPFIYDKFLIMKLLQINLKTYNEFMDLSINENTLNDENIRNIFADINELLLSERNASAENGITNAKAIDTFNRYQRKDGGFGIVVDKKGESEKREIYLITDEEAQKKLNNNFGFSKMLEAKK